MIGLVGFHQKNVGDFVLLLNDPMGDIALAGLGLLDIARQQADAGGHQQEEIVGDQVDHGQRIENHGRDLVGEHQHQRDQNRGDEVHPDETAAIDYDHDHAGVIIAVEGRRHDRGHRHNAQPGRRHLERQHILSDLFEIMREGEREIGQQDGAANGVANDINLGQGFAAHPHVEQAEQHVKRGPRKQIDADEHHGIQKRPTRKAALGLWIVKTQPDPRIRERVCRHAIVFHGPSGREPPRASTVKD